MHNNHKLDVTRNWQLLFNLFHGVKQFISTSRDPHKGRAIAQAVRRWSNVLTSKPGQILSDRSRSSEDFLDYFWLSPATHHSTIASYAFIATR